MPTLRQKVNQFCVVAGTTNASSLRIAKLEEALKKAKDDMKAHKKDMKYQQAQTRKAAKKPKKAKTLKAPKAPKVQMNPLPAQAEPMMPAPVAPPSLAPVAPAAQKGGRTRRRPVMRW
jgi:hypothetical protein